MAQVIEVAAVLARLAQLDARERSAVPGGVTVSMARVPGGGEGRRGSPPGQCRVVAVKAEHHGMFLSRAEVVLFTQPG